MLDVQRKRLRHLMANAILDLWKKETGSLSSVIIEGTICITAGGGHTIVVQVEDHFHGVLPDRYDQDVHGHDAHGYASKSVAAHNHSGETDGERRREERVSGVKRGVDHSSSIDLSQSTGHVRSVGSSVYQADVSSESTASPDRDSLRHEKSRSETKDTVTSRSDSVDQEVFYPSEKQTSVSQESSEESDSDIEIDATDDVVPYVPRPDEQKVLQKRSESFSAPADELSSSGYSSTLGRSFYSSLSKSQSSGISELKSPDNIFTPYREKTNTTPLRRRSASPTLLKGSPSMSTSTPKDFLKRPRLESDQTAVTSASQAAGVNGPEVKTEVDDVAWSHHSLGTPVSKSGSILDLSYQRDHDLALSPPQNYTAQVRHVIRQRLLANRNSSSGQDEEASQANGKDGGEGSAPPSSSSSVSTSTTVTIDTSAPALPFFFGQTPPVVPPGDKESWADKLPAMPPSGPASWPVAGQEKSPSLGDSKFFLPGHFSPMLSVGVPGMPPLLPSSMSPAMFPSAFSPGFPPRLPLPPGISLQDLANISKTQLTSPGPQPPLTLVHPPSAPPPGSRDDDTRSYSTQASGRSTPEVTDINGNSTEKEVTTNGSDQKVYVCEYCNKHFLFKSKYHEHLPVHTNARPYQCHLCSRTYKYKYDLQVHLRTHMGIPTKSTVCPFCSGKFLTNKMLRNHIVESHQDRQKVTKEECTQPVDNLPPAL